MLFTADGIFWSPLGLIGLAAALFGSRLHSPVPMERVLRRISLPSSGSVRGLVDTTGFAHRADQMDRVVPFAKEMEASLVAENERQFGLSNRTRFVFGICPHDDYMLAGRVYYHVHRYVRARTVFLLGNAHWAETFGIRNRLIFGAFRYWRGPYGKIPVSPWRDQILNQLPDHCYVINRTVVETEHSLEAQIPFLQFFNREVTIVPVLVPFMEWDRLVQVAEHLAQIVARLVKSEGLKLGSDVTILCSTDGQHYGDYGWSYYDFHPFGCNAEGYEKAMALDRELVQRYLTGGLAEEKIRGLYVHLVDDKDIRRYRISWCGRFAVSFAACFAARLVSIVEGRTLDGHFLRHSSSIGERWLPLWDLGLGLTGDANLHHFVTYVGVGFV